MTKKPKRGSAVGIARKHAPPRRAELRRNGAHKDVQVADVVASERSAPARDGRVPVVGIGASAGGLEAFTQLLRGLPKDTGMAFVLVQHLAPDHESMLTELVSKATSMPVTEVTDGVRVEANHVYVIPPNRNMGIEDGVLHLAARTEPRGLHMPIDTFLTSLAAANRSQAIGVILSGTASDGAMGLKAIKSEGGITVVQDPKSARYDGMPRAAIAAGAVDFVASIDRMGAELAKIARHPYVARATADESELPGEEEHIARIFAMVRAATGVDFTYYKRATVNRRMRRRMALHKLERLPDYVHLLQHDPAEVEKLCQDVFIHVTGFFRDPEMFEALKETVFPELVKQHADGSPFRIWISGCSTGEEAYSFAIALLESMGPGAGDAAPAFQIFATDISSTAVDRARAGFYPESIAADVSEDRLRRCFQRVDGGYRIIKSIRDLCVFARQDVTKDPPFSKLDLISCRNLLIYLGSVLQKRVLSVFHYALNPGGFLVLGTSETIGPNSDLFLMNDRRYKVFVRKATVARGSLDFRSGDTGDAVDGGRRPALPGRAPSDLRGHVDRMLLEEYVPAAVLVDGDMQIVTVHGETGRYLRPARGEASLSVLKMAREGLSCGPRSTPRSAGTPRSGSRACASSRTATRGPSTSRSVRSPHRVPSVTTSSCSATASSRLRWRRSGSHASPALA